PGVGAQAQVLGQRCALVRVEEMEFEVAADAEPDQLFRVELRRYSTLVETEQLAVKRARLVAAAGRGRDRDRVQLQPHECMQSDRRTTKALRRGGDGMDLPLYLGAVCGSLAGCRCSRALRRADDFSRAGSRSEKTAVKRVRGYRCVRANSRMGA